MAEETYGIETLKRVVDVGISFTQQATKAVKGKFKLLYLLGFLDEAQKLTELLVEKELIVLEFKDLSDDEKAELVAYAVEEFDIADDSAEVFVENSLKLGLSIVNLFNEGKKVFKKK